MELEAGGEPAVPHKDTGTPLAETAGHEVGSQGLDMSIPKAVSRQSHGHGPQLLTQGLDTEHPSVGPRRPQPRRNKGSHGEHSSPAALGHQGQQKRCLKAERDVRAWPLAF